jgi:hypothetical protein
MARGCFHPGKGEGVLLSCSVHLMLPCVGSYEMMESYYKYANRKYLAHLHAKLYHIY